MRVDPICYPLASNASVTGNPVAVTGGEYMFMVEGTVGGSTISLQVQLPSGNWADVAPMAGSVTVKTTSLPYVAGAIDLPAGLVRVAMNGGTPSGINAWLAGIG